MYLFAFGNRRQPCTSVKYVLKCSNAICEWPELFISIKSVVLLLYCIAAALLLRQMKRHKTSHIKAMVDQSTTKTHTGETLTTKQPPLIYD